MLEEIVATRRLVILLERKDYNDKASKVYDMANNALEHAHFPYVLEVVAHPFASIEELLAIKALKSAVSPYNS